MKKHIAGKHEYEKSTGTAESEKSKTIKMQDIINKAVEKAMDTNRTHEPTTSSKEIQKEK